MTVIVDDCTQDDPEELAYENIGWECEVITNFDIHSFLLKDMYGRMFTALKRDCTVREVE